jgi:hypothetical protein
MCWPLDIGSAQVPGACWLESTGKPNPNNNPITLPLGFHFLVSWLWWTWQNVLAQSLVLNVINAY